MVGFVKGRGKEDWEEVLTIREEIERVGVFVYGRDVRVKFGGSACWPSLFLQEAWAWGR